MVAYEQLSESEKMDQVADLGDFGSVTSAIVPTVLIGSQLAAQNKRKEKARVAARARRSQEATIIMEMANELQITQERMRRTDKATIVKLAIDYIKAFEILCRFRSNYESNIEVGGGAFSDADAAICERSVGRVELIDCCDSGICSETSGNSDGDDEVNGDSSATYFTCNNGIISPNSSSCSIENSGCLQLSKPQAYCGQSDFRTNEPLTCTTPVLPPATSNKRLHSVSNLHQPQYQHHQELYQHRSKQSQQHQQGLQQHQQSKPGQTQPQPCQPPAVPFNKHPAPKLSTRSIFTPKTDDMDLHFLLIDEREDGRSQFVLKPDTEIEDDDDLTHLAPQSGDISISLEVEPLEGIILDTGLFGSGSPPIKKLMSKDLMENCCIDSIEIAN